MSKPVRSPAHPERRPPELVEAPESKDPLFARLRAAHEPPPEADDPAFWAAFEADLAHRLRDVERDRRPGAAPARRRRALGVTAGVLALAAAAALVLIAGRARLRPHPLPVPPVRAIAEDELLGPGDVTELVDELDLEELRLVETHFKEGA